MSFKLWVDEQVFAEDAPEHHVPDGYMVASNMVAALAICQLHGSPSHLDINCDFKDGKDIMELLYWLERNYHRDIPRVKCHCGSQSKQDEIIRFINGWIGDVAAYDLATD